MRFDIQRILFAAVVAEIFAVASPLTTPERPSLNVELNQPESGVGETAFRKLTGKFLHITDLHLDRFYAPGSLTEKDEVCHHGKGNAGYLGSPGSDCDSPELLINQTFEWIDNNLRDKIDFIVWTGDSARHDNDELIPRTENQIEEFNAFVANKFIDVFSHRDEHPNGALIIPIVPNIGNNDIMPHNIFEKGPNRWTEKLSQLWDVFIPEEQRHTFVEGGWFYTEVIPNKLAVFSLNTLYFFDSNKAVDGCAQSSEPGYHQMEWLRVQLQLLRERGMKAILTGHVPPARSADKQSWDETCWQKYTLWLRQYRDVVVSSMYGHMNIDHFMLQDSDDLDIDSILHEEPVSPFTTANNHDNLTVQSKTSYLASLRDLWADLPAPPASVLEDWSIQDVDEIEPTKDKKKSKKGGKKDGKKKKDKKKKDKKKKGEKEKKKFYKKIGGRYAERFSLSLVSPSVVPNYFPTLRVLEYDISGLENIPTWAEVQKQGNKKQSSWTEREIEIQKKSKKSPIPDPPNKSAPLGPAYSRQPLTLLNYAQYYANITQAEKSLDDERAEKPGNEDAFLKKPQLHYELEYHTLDDDFYKLQDLTMPNLYDLASRIGADGSLSDPPLSSETNSISTQLMSSFMNSKQQPIQGDEEDTKNGKKKKKHKKNKNKKNKAWRAFIERAFVGFLTSREIEDNFENYQ